LTSFKKLALACIGVLAVAAFVGVSAASAAQHLWTVGGSPVTGSSAVTSSSTGLTLTHVDALNVTHKLSCPGTDSGTVNTNGDDTVTAVTVGTCTNVQNCTNPAASALNLPWTTKLNTVTPIRDTIDNTNHNPGWSATCSGVTVRCTGPTNVAITDLGTGHVKATLDATSPGPNSCSDGHVTGSHVDGDIDLTNATTNLGVQP
jgi:hypothetical protein